jgi:RHH-type rel operon transcriptional repressor/antitoxin RelB
MAVSVRMDPLLEKELEIAARRRGVTKSQFIVDAVQTALGHRDPYELLLRVEQEMAPYRANAAKSPRSAKSADVTGVDRHEDRFREALRVKHEAELADWQAYHGVTPVKRAARKSGAKSAGKGARA